MLELVTGKRLRRADLCADAIGLDLETIDPRAWLTPRRARVKTFGNLQVPFVEHHKTEKRTGFQIGQGALVARVYDKRVELALRPEEKRSIEEARWKGAGWNGQADVVRIEFQMRGEALDEIDDGRLRDPEVLLARLNPIGPTALEAGSSWSSADIQSPAPLSVDEGWKVIQAPALARTPEKSPSESHVAASDVHASPGNDLQLSRGQAYARPASHRPRP